MTSRSSVHSQSRSDLEVWVFRFWLLLLLWMPWPLASNRPWAWGLLEALSFLLAAAWLFLWVLDRATVTPAARRAWPVFTLLVSWMLWTLLTAVPLPIEWVAKLAPRSAELFLLVDAKRTTATLSLEPQQTLSKVLLSLCYAVNFFLALVLINTRDRVKTFGYLLVASGVIMAVYATLMHLANLNITYLGTEQMHGDNAMGPTGSRNIFANYLVLLLSLGIGLLMAQLRGSSASNWKQRIKRIIESMFSTKIILRLSLCVLVIALTTTHSRMGNASFFASLVLAGLLGLALSRHAPKGTVLLLSSLVVLDLFIVGSWFGVEKLAQRIEQTTQAEYQARQDPSEFVFSQINHFPVFGSGLGTFYTVFQNYRTQNVIDYYDYAHNDFAQIAAETGWVGLSLLGGVVVLSFGAALVAQWRRRDPLMRGLSFASIMAVIAMMIHSWVDFNLQIPANTVLFMVLLACAWISLSLDRRDAARRSGG